MYFVYMPSEHIQSKHCHIKADVPYILLTLTVELFFKFSKKNQNFPCKNLVKTISPLGMAHFDCPCCLQRVDVCRKDTF